MKWFDVRYVRNYSGKKGISFFQKGPQNSEKTNAAVCRHSRKSGATLRHWTPEKDEIFLFFQRLKSTAAADMRNFAGHGVENSPCLSRGGGWEISRDAVQVGKSGNLWIPV
tara:strand:+ start:159 stop:491 length:333 start_codon:yes stop_codon:yes gene_type:complete